MNNKLNKLYCNKKTKRSQKYKILKKEYEKKKKKRKGYFYTGRLDTLKRTNSRQYYAELDKLMKTGGEKHMQNDEIPSMEGKTDGEKADIIADHIESLTANYTPINSEEMHEEYPGGKIRQLTYNEVLTAFKKCKIPNGLHQNDPPKQILMEIKEQLAVPLTYLLWVD